jgi:ATP-dependent DNA helicase DinG
MTTTLAPVQSWDDVQELFAQAMPGYQERTEQTRLAHTIEAAFTEDGWLMAQGGCGIGKSFAGLVPAILWALRTGQTVAVATATKALQTQYATKDLPFLAELFAAAGVPFTWSVLKGRGSYICKSKLNDSELTADDVFNLAALKEELENETHTGDLDDLVTQFDLKQKSKITSSSDECPGKDECPFGDVCFAEGAKARAKKAHIVVVNHSVLVTDALLRMKSNGQISLLPEELGAVIIDEAHELCSYTSSALGSRITRGTFRSFGRDVARWLGGDERAAGNLYRANDELFIALSAVLKRNRAVRIRPEDDRVMLPVLKALTSVKDEIKHLVEDLRAVEVRGDDRKLQARKRLVKRARSLTEKVVEVATAESDVLVRWVSQEFTAQGEDVVLEFAPLHVGEFLNRNVWHSPALYDEDGTQLAPPTKRAVVLMSATLAVGSDFSFLAKTLGLSDYTGFDAGTPFDFAKQAAVYVPKPKSDANPRGFADPTKDVATWRTQAQRVMRELITAAGGRTLLLFTSRAAMREAYTMLADYLTDELGVRVLMQGEASNRELADTFRADETSVLFGLNSFMTGLDVQGDALRVVVLDKVPFTSPDDVLYAARCEAMDRAVTATYGLSGSKATFHREGSFFGRSVPEATLVMLQAIGRGIRTVDDEALLVTLDPRLLSKGYGKQMLAALPKAKRLENLNQAKDYLAELSARRDN